MIKKSALTFGFLFIVISASFADIVYLKNGNQFEAVVLHVDEEEVVMEIAGGEVQFEKSKIVGFEKASDAENEVLLEKWENSKNLISTADNQTEKTNPEDLIPKDIQKLKKKPAGYLKLKKRPPPMRWYTQFNRGKQLGKQYNAPIIIEFYTDWCPYCQKFREKTLPDETVQKTLKSFVKVRINAEKNKRLAKKFGVKGYPTFVFLDYQEKVILKVAGFMDAEEFVFNLREALKHHAPNALPE